MFFRACTILRISARVGMPSYRFARYPGPIFQILFILLSRPKKMFTPLGLRLSGSVHRRSIPETSSFRG
jgi:hypothetical protein